jgi:hypothetical protein
VVLIFGVVASDFTLIPHEALEFFALFGLTVLSGSSEPLFAQWTGTLGVFAGGITFVDFSLGLFARLFKVVAESFLIETRVVGRGVQARPRNILVIGIGRLFTLTA